jgi:hypothetical protein
MKMNEVDGCHQIQVQLTNKVAADGISMISWVPNMIDGRRLACTRHDKFNFFFGLGSYEAQYRTRHEHWYVDTDNNLKNWLQFNIFKSVGGGLVLVSDTGTHLIRGVSAFHSILLYVFQLFKSLNHTLSVPNWVTQLVILHY